MKRIAKISVILGIIFIVSSVLATALFFMEFEKYVTDNHNWYSLKSDSKVFSYEGINYIKTESVSEDIFVETIQGNEFIFNLTGYYPDDKDFESLKLVFSQTGDRVEVKVKYPERFFLWIGPRDSKLYIGVPESYNGNFAIKDISGDIKVAEISLKDFEIETISGDIEVAESEFDGGNFGTVSGEIVIKDSGIVKSLESASGDVELENINFDKKSNIDTISGDIVLKLAKGFSVDLNFDSVSGDLRNNFGDISGGDYRINVETTSGDLTIY